MILELAEECGWNHFIFLLLFEIQIDDDQTTSKQIRRSKKLWLIHSGDEIAKRH
jgi:hypothetical protein